MIQLFFKEESQDGIKVTSSLSQELAFSAVERDINSGCLHVEIGGVKKIGLLSLVIPLEYGRVDATWVGALKIFQELSQADGVIGQFYGDHINLTALAYVSGTPEQKGKYYRETATRNLFWANAINTQDTKLKITPEGENYLVNRVTSFGRDVKIPDYPVFSVLNNGVEMPLIFVIPKDRDGIIANQDWGKLNQQREDNHTYFLRNFRC
jgi:alkylation response protein AidB-like acyl-CoA dehydrogenase